MSLEITFRTSPLEAFETTLGGLPFAWEQDGNAYEHAFPETPIPCRLPNKRYRRSLRHCPPVWLADPLTRDHWTFFQGAAHSHQQLGSLQ